MPLTLDFWAAEGFKMKRRRKTRPSMKLEMKLLGISFLFLLLPFSSAAAAAATLADINGGNGVANAHYEPALRLATTVSEMRAVEIPEKIGLQTLEPVHSPANQGNEPLIEKPNPYFFRVIENNPSKKKTIIAFIPGDRKSMTAFCLELIGKIMKKLLQPLSIIFKSSTNISHQRVLERYDEIAVYEAFRTMGCEAEAVNHSFEDASMSTMTICELLRSSPSYHCILVSCLAYLHHVANHMIWLKVLVFSSLLLGFIFMSDLLFGFCPSLLGFSEIICVFFGLLMLRTVLEPYTSQQIKKYSKHYEPVTAHAKNSKRKGRTVIPPRRSVILRSIIDNVIKHGLRNRKHSQPIIKENSGLFITEDDSSDLADNRSLQHHESPTGLPLDVSGSNLDSVELRVNSNSFSELKTHGSLRKRPHRQFDTTPSTSKCNCSRFSVYLATILVIIILAMGYLARQTLIRTADKVEVTASKISEEVSDSAHKIDSRSLLPTRVDVIGGAKSKKHKLNCSTTAQQANRWRGSSTESSGGTTNMKLRIGVPVKNGFHEFIEVYCHPKDNHAIVTGFVVDVFKEVMEALPYEVSWEFIPYETGNEGNTGYYDELVYQLSLKRYDGIIGDVTMTANRLKYGDFSLPFMTSGVSMIVPIDEDNDLNSLLWFLKPLSIKMWMITITVFLLKGILVWFFEHETNEDFQGSTSERVGKILFFSFSIFVYAQKEKLQSNYSRFIVNLWMMTVFFIVAVYNANLSLMLSIGPPQVTIRNLETLIKNGDYVGYQNGSFVFELLKNQGFQESKLKAYATEAEYAEALSKGSRNNGVSAIVDEIPYIRVFLTHYGQRYAMGGLNHFISTGGFGFVFSKGSKIVHDISGPILELEEVGIMSRIRKRWLEPLTCSFPPQSPGTFKELGPNNLAGVFIMTGPAVGGALLVYMVIWIYRCKKDVIKKQLEKIKGKVSGWYSDWWAI